MYRYSVDQEIVYTSGDLTLFRESPFAAWMERLTLENPDHGIAPDEGVLAPHEVPVARDDLAQTLQDEGKNVVSIDLDTSEAMRRTATLAAMRHGVDFIVDGQLAVGPLSDHAKLLMRTSGYSELGKYLYIPCDTETHSTPASIFHLCFLADLLHSLQGQLPPQMLMLRASSGVVPIQTDEHIFIYRAIKQRFMAAQNSFRKHRMPDPLESAHFGRWSRCANELVRKKSVGQAAVAPLAGESRAVEEEPVPEMLPSVQRVAGSSAYDLDTVVHGETGDHSGVVSAQAGTLAEQARLLRVDTVHAGIGDGGNMETLAFIGSSAVPPMIGEEPLPGEAKPQPAPPASLRNPANVDLDSVQDVSPKLGLKPVSPFSSSLITNSEN